MKHLPFILASASPRRLDLLQQIGLIPAKVLPANIDEAEKKNEHPRALALRLAQEKAMAIPHEDGHFIIAADTVVAVGRRILPKAETDRQVADCLQLMSGRSHIVYGGIGLKTPTGELKSRVVATRVKFKALNKAEIAAYVASGEGIGKAGGYAIQGLAASYIIGINGSYSNIVGLSLYDIQAMLSGIGFYTSQTNP